jgi:hypothetical protein
VGASRCPPWFVTDRRAFDGEESRVHIGRPIRLAQGLVAQLCSSADPDGFADGPRILVGSDEWTAVRARSVARSLLALADQAESERPQRS